MELARFGIYAPQTKSNPLANCHETHNSRPTIGQTLRQSTQIAATILMNSVPEDFSGTETTQANPLFHRAKTLFSSLFQQLFTPPATQPIREKRQNFWHIHLFPLRE